ncbi:hypothetical protein NM688_g1185 [Phlebia brevispora]|uniref:Uncharacterized protein n=1 Tax=Phlebia brevispora TaxID=194682 RepID=A0ACC1TC11_9APHY|nr:hypothetical protein NM688_g1185 [Phlebia brevispora]
MSLTKGTSGRPVNVYTNSFQISRLPLKKYYHYDVVTKHGATGAASEIPSGRRVTEIIDRLQTDNPATFNPPAAFDGVKNLFTTRKIEEGRNSFTVNMGVQVRATGQYTVRLGLVSEIDPSDIEKLTSSRGAETLGVPNNANTIALTLLQVILSQGPQLQYKFSLHAKSFFITAGKRDLSGGISAWKGFFQSVRATAGRIIVNVDTTTAAFYKDSDLISSALEVLGCRDIRDLVRACASDQNFQKLRSFLRGVLVEVQPGNRTKRIADLVRNAGREEFFKDNEKMTVAEYWASHHHRRLQFPDMFGIKLKSGAIFPAEACKIKPGQRYKKHLSPEDTAAFLKVSVWSPEDRLNAVTDAVQGSLFNYASSPWMIESGMRVDPEPLRITGRELTAPQVLYGAGALRVSGGAWNVIKQRFRVPAHIKAWAIVVFDKGQDIQGRVDAFEGALVSHMVKLGMTVDQGATKEMGNPQDVQRSIESAALKSVRGLPPTADGKPQKPSIVVVILPPGGNEVRRQVKQWGDVLRGIPTQCVKAGKYDSQKGREQYCSNVALKINVKAGGINSYVQPKTSVINIMQESMIVGCDVTHPAPGVMTRPSVASLVSSIDEGATRYRAYVDAQPPRQEMITNIAGMLEAALKTFHQRRHVLPKTVIVYRDGVSEGEYWKVDEQEIKRVEEMLNRVGQMFKVPPPQLVFIVVGKRHHIRFFPSDSSGKDKSGNCNPGLVVDDGIVHSKLMDFYLQSHGGLLGTSRPSHYVVLRNGPQFTADQLQELSYALCFVYAAATRSVSIPAPVYYADKVCTRAEFQFDPQLRYADETSSDGAQFDLEKWKNGLRQSALSADMYFV